VGPVWLDLPPLEERQLLSQKQFFRSQRCAGTYHLDKQPTQVEEGDACSLEAVSQSGEVNSPVMNAEDRTLPDVTSCDPAIRPSFCGSQG
jgi:hypothetical protein